MILVFISFSNMTRFKHFICFIESHSTPEGLLWVEPEPEPEAIEVKEVGVYLLAELSAAYYFNQVS